MRVLAVLGVTLALTSCTGREGRAPGSAGPTPSDDELERDELVTVCARVAGYQVAALHEEPAVGYLVWHDAVTVHVLSPPEWAGKKLLLYCDGTEPEDSPWRKAGSTYRFALARKYLVGRYPLPGVGGYTEYVPCLGSVKGKPVLVSQGEPNPRVQTGAAGEGEGDRDGEE